MSGLISKKPLVGFATSIIFSALGVLLVSMDTPRAGLSRWMFKIVGYFVLFAGINALVAALYAVVKGSGKQD